VIKTIGRKIFNMYKRCLVFCALRTPIKERVIVEAFLGKRDDDNISCYLAEIDETETPIYYVQTYNNRKLIPKGTRLIKKSLRYIWFMHTSSLIITNSRLHSDLVLKREGQKVLQFWHGIPWKKLAYDQPDIQFAAEDKAQYLARFKQDVAKWDYLWTPNKYAEQKFRSAFQYKGRCITAMYPADVDLLRLEHKKDYVTGIKEALGIPRDKKVILYMPTFREYLSDRSGKYQYYSNIDVEQFARNNASCIILARLHYLVDKAWQTKVNNLIDVSHYSSINDLYLISDVLVTDYSSAIYSFSLLQKPIISLQFDLAEYESVRGLYEDATTGMDIIAVNDVAAFNRINLQHDLQMSKAKDDYYDMSFEAN